MSMERVLLGHAALPRPRGPGRFGAVLGQGVIAAKLKTVPLGP